MPQANPGATQSITMAARRLFDTADQSVQLIGHLIGHIDTMVDEVGRDSRRVADESRDFASAVADRFHTARRGLQASPKALRVATVLISIAARYRLEQGRSQSAEHHSFEAAHAWGARTLRSLCIETRGTFLKLGQFLSMRPDLLPPAYIEQLATLRDQVPAVPFELIAARIESELGKPIKELFADFETDPVAAASLAQVHRARTFDGQALAVKIQVPGVEDQLDSDIAILRAIAASIPEDALPFDLKSVLSQLANSVHEELDYEAEARHCEAFGLMFASHNGIRCPEIVPELSTERVITMEWIEGEALDRALAKASLLERKKLLTTLVSSYCTQILCAGYFHADPHAGNFLVPKEGGLVLLDFGCVQRLSPEVRDAYVALMKAVFMSDSDALFAQLQRLGFASEGCERADLEALVTTMLDLMKRPDALAEWAADPTAATQTLIDAMQSAAGLNTPQHFVMLGRVLATLGGILIEHSDTGISLPAILAASLAASLTTATK